MIQTIKSTEIESPESLENNLIPAENQPSSFTSGSAGRR